MRLAGVPLHLVTPAGPGPATGNRVTAERWADLWRRAGARVSVATGYDGEPATALVALHATKSLASIERWLAARPAAPLVIALGGTDIFGDLAGSPRALAALGRAARIVVLEGAALAALPESLQARCTVIEQSAKPVRRAAPNPERFEVLLLAHLRAVKDPLLAAQAASLLPRASCLVVLHAGAALELELGARAAREAAANPRYRWFGEVSHAAARELLAHARLCLSTSRHESGANALVEALASGVPLLATRIPGTVSLLGSDHPGLFEPGDAHALAALFERAERDAAFLADLETRSAALAARFDPEREFADWLRLFADLGLG
jgi:putative glycosyltransferase (TIGR04348 family)